MPEAIPVTSNADISPEEGAKIVAEAKGWKGTPYLLIGAQSVKATGGDCSGSTWRIYSAAGFPYQYQQAKSFGDYAAKTGRFRELGANEAKQEGDLLSWTGHIAIYTNFGNDPEDAITMRTNSAGKPWKQVNDMWSATREGGDPYKPNNMAYFKGGVMPRIFRYQKAGATP